MRHFSSSVFWLLASFSATLLFGNIWAQQSNATTEASNTTRLPPNDELTSTSSPASSSTTLSPTTTEKSQEVEKTEEIENFQGDLSDLLPSNYVPYQLPIVSGAQFVPVFVSLFITAVADIDEQGGQITLDTHYARRWVDYKISRRMTGPLKNATLGPEALDKIWKPDIYFDGTSQVEKDAADATQKTIRILFNTSDLKEAQIAFSESIEENIFYHCRDLCLICDLTTRLVGLGVEEHHTIDNTIPSRHSNLYLPFTKLYTQNRLKLFWETPHSLFLRDPGHPNFDLGIDSVWPNIVINGSNKLFVEETFDPFRKGNYSALTFTIRARRKLSYHLVQTYLPSILLILMTWLCFLLPASMVEARIGISMTTVLTLTAMFAAVREQAPKVSYTMAIDLWMVFSIFIVFVSLLVFTFTYWLKTRAVRKYGEQKEKRLESPDGVEQFIDEDIAADVKKEYSVLLRLTKYYAFFIFALTFLVFVAVYWWWLLTFSNYFGWNPSPEFNAVADEDEGGSGTPYFHFYRYLVEDSAMLFNSEIYHPLARTTLKKVFGLIQ